MEIFLVASQMCTATYLWQSGSSWFITDVLIKMGFEASTGFTRGLTENDRGDVSAVLTIQYKITNETTAPSTNLSSRGPTPADCSSSCWRWHYGCDDIGRRHHCTGLGHVTRLSKWSALSLDFVWKFQSPVVEKRGLFLLLLTSSMPQVLSMSVFTPKYNSYYTNWTVFSSSDLGVWNIYTILSNQQITHSITHCQH